MRKHILRIVAATGLAAGAAFASTPGHDAPAAHGAPHWAYHGKEGTEHWAELAPEFAACKQGTEQSPIDIRTSIVVKAPLEKIEFDYAPSVAKIVNNGHTIQVNYEKGSGIKVGADQYDLLQFHFHTPSEEEIDGKSYPLVAHLVHKNADGQLAVVAVLFENGEENAFLKSFWDYLPKAAGEPRAAPKAKLKLSDALPKLRTYFTFPGSLTTPPCSEQVRWFVLKTPVTISATQIAAFRKIYAQNNRPIQSLGKRVVREGG